jgi:subtilisin-like proprotein convertase family protein
MGQNIPPIWIMQEDDDSLLQGGQITSFSVTVYPYQLPTGAGIVETLNPGQVYFSYINVPTDAIELINAVSLLNGTTGDLSIYMSPINGAATNLSDGTNFVLAPANGLSFATNCLILTNGSLPIPLTGGMWYYGIYNVGATAVTFTNQITIIEGNVPNLVQTYTNSTWTPLTTDGTTNSSTICITNGNLAEVLDLSVGLRLADTNLDDVTVTLTSPQGTQIILFENRGGILTSNLGLSEISVSTNVSTSGTNTSTNIIVATNYIYTVFTEDTNLADVPIKFAPPPYAADNSNGYVTLSGDGFEATPAGVYAAGQPITGTGWQVTSNEVSVVTDPTVAYAGSNYLALANGTISQTYSTVAGASYEVIYYARSPGLTNWWPADDTPLDIISGAAAATTGIIYDVGEHADAFTFANAGSSVDFGPGSGNLGTNEFSVDFWIKCPTNNANAAEAILQDQTNCESGNFFDLVLTTNGTLRYSDSGQTPPVSVTGTSVITNGLYHHVALTRQSATVSIYVDGTLDTNLVETNVANLNGVADLLAGVSACTNDASFVGDLDEVDLWQRALSPAEVYAIYQAATAGKYSANGLLYPNFQLGFSGISTNVIVVTNFALTNWQAFTNSFIASNIQTTITLAGNTLGVLLDNVQVVQLPFTNYDNYYLPEEPLAPIIGQNPQGCWTLSIWNGRLDSTAATNGALLSWTLQMTTSSTNVNLITFTNATTNFYVSTNLATNTILYFGIDVPATAIHATNILLSASGAMNLYFNQSALPTGALPGDVDLISLTTAGSGTNTIADQGAPPPLIPGQRYFLGVQNAGTNAESFTLEVNFDVGTNVITPLTDAIPLTNTVTNAPEFYSFSVPNNAVLAVFQVLNPTAAVSLYAREGLPVPGPLDFDYESLSTGASDQFIAVTTNSVPVALPLGGSSSTMWYLTVSNITAASASYTILATYETASNMDIVPLSDGVAVPANAGPGFPTNLLYSFTVTGTNVQAIQFTVTDLSTNGSLELLVGNGAFPTPDDFYIGSFEPGTNAQFVSIVTNASLTNLDGVWYAAVPVTSATNVNYSITAALVTNGPVAGAPLFGASSFAPATGLFTLNWKAVAGQRYTVWASSNLINWTAVTLFTANSSTASYTDSVPVKTQPARYYRLSLASAPPTPSLRGEALAAQTGSFTMHWSATAGQGYSIWSSTNLLSWVKVTSVTAQGSTASYTASVPAGQQSAHFYRISMP